MEDSTMETCGLITNIENTKDISQGIIDGKINIVNVVEQLGPMLTDINPEQRTKGTQILSSILELLPVDLLNSTQLNFISTFYADRLKDHHQVIPAVLNGILYMTKMKNIPDGSATKILNTMFKEIACQQQQQPDRLKIYKIFKGFMINKLTELQAMSFDLVYGVISAMDSERDPKNLKFLFDWLPSFIVNVKLGHLTEEMFEVMACYFPVDFRAPSNDPNQISRDSLASALSFCLTAISDFGEFCLPLAIEKYSSNLKVAKLDSVDLLIKGCKTFSVEQYLSNFNELWNIIQQDVFTSTDVEIKEASLSLLTAVLSKICSSETQNGFTSTLSDKITTFKANLLPDNKLFKSTSEIFAGISKSSGQCCEMVINDILPIYVDVYKISNKPEEQHLIFEQIYSILKHSSQVIAKQESVRKVIVEIALKSLINENIPIRSLGLTVISTLATIMTIEERKVFYDSLQIFLIKQEDLTVRKSLLSTFKTFACSFDLEIKDVISKLTVNNVNEKALLYEALRELILVENFTEYILNSYVKNITPANACQISILNLKLALEEANNNNNSVAFKYIQMQNVLENLCEICASFNNSDITQNIDLLNNIMGIFITCVSNELMGDFTEFAKDVHKKYGESEQHTYLIILYAILSRFKTYNTYFDNIFEILPNIILNDENAFIKEKATFLLANITNKYLDDTTLETYLNEIDEKCKNCTNEESILHLRTFITKALLKNGSKFYTNWKEKLFNLLENSANAASSFKVVLSDNYDCLNNKSFCTVRLLYKQRFFIDVCTKLNNDYSDNNNYLLAYGFLMQEVPLNVFRMHFKQVLRLTILCLDKSDNVETLCSVLSKLNSLLENKDEIMEEHLQEFIPRFLKLSKFKGSMKVRIAALICLRQFTTAYTTYKLLPFKQDVVYELISTLDDPKRLVRKEAVLTRSNWILLDAPI